MENHTRVVEDILANIDAGECDYALDVLADAVRDRQTTDHEYHVFYAGSGELESWRGVGQQARVVPAVSHRDAVGQWMRGEYSRQCFVIVVGYDRRYQKISPGSVEEISSHTVRIFQIDQVGGTDCCDYIGSLGGRYTITETGIRPGHRA